MQPGGGAAAASDSPPAVALLCRRPLLLALLALPLNAPPRSRAADASLTATPFSELEARAKASYQARDLPTALRCLDELVRREPAEPVWRERRAQVLLDLKRFDDALAEFDAASARQPPGFVSLGLLANRALAHEGLSQWREAEADYTRSLTLAEATGYSQPYVLNSRGNCRAALGDWTGALEDYRASSRVFREVKNLSGSIYAESNAALVEAQLRLPDAEKHVEAVARRAAGSIDMRAALAALRWSAGDPEGAETLWAWACTNINSGQVNPGGPVLDGCALYRDDNWVRTVRRWPPRMAGLLSDFLALRAPSEQ